MAILAKIKNFEGTGKDWSPTRYHSVDPYQVGFSPRAWRVVEDVGVQVSGEDKVRRSRGTPTTLSTVIRTYGRFAQNFYDEALFYAVIANESRGVLVCSRVEARLNDVSYGPGQFLTATAHWLLLKNGFQVPDRPIPEGGSEEKWSRYLCNALHASRLIQIYLVHLNTRFGLKGDPILTYAAYNAGSPQPSKKSDWGLVHHGPALDNIAAWLGDAYFLLNPENA